MNMICRNCRSFIRERHLAFTGFLTIALCFSVAMADPGGVADTDAGTYTLDKDSAYTVTSEDVSAAAGLAIVKKGSGTVTAGAALASFAGEIRIEEGIWLVTDSGGLGTADGGTVVSNGAALHVSCATKDGITFAKNETLTIVGSGPDGKGAYFNTTSQQHYKLFDNRGDLILSGDAKVGGVGNFGVGRGNLRMNGHTMTIAMNSNGVAFDMGCRAIYTPGHFVVSTGRIFFDGSAYDTVWNGGSANTVTVASSAQVGFRAVKTAIPYSLIMANNTTFYPSNDAYENNWGGPVRLNGTVKVSYGASANHAMVISGPVSGPGGFQVLNGETLRLTGTTNSFAGGVSITDGSRLILSHAGALPPDGGGITCTSGTIITRNDAMTLPDITACSACVLSNSAPGTVVTIGNITKNSGSETTLALIGGIHVTNRLDVQVGQLKLGRMGGASTTEAGLYSVVSNFADQAAMDAWVGWGLSNRNATDTRLNELAAKFFGEGQQPVHANRPELAYMAWSEATTGRYPLGIYKGYFRNISPTNVVASFVTSIADIAVVWLDGKVISKACQSTQVTGGSESTHFLVHTAVTLAPGMHEFMFLVGHRNSSSMGPKVKTGDQALVGATWSKSNFGLAWRLGTEEPNSAYLLGVALNSADYMAVDNTGDFTLLVKDVGYLEGEQADERMARWFSPFAASASFAVGTSLDLGGTPTSLPFVLGNLTGTPTVSGGALELVGTWSPTAAGLAAQPLTLSDATLSFGDDAKVSIPVPSPVTAVRVANAPAGSAIVGVPSVTAEMKDAFRKCGLVDAGESVVALDVLPVIGLRMIIR